MNLKKRILQLAYLSLVLMATPSHALYTYQQALEEYVKGLDYLDDKVFIYQVDLSGNGYQDLLLTTSNNIYADLNRFGLRAFVIYPRLPTSTENYLPAANIPLYASDELGMSSEFSDQQVILKSYGTPHKNSATPEYYYWMDREYKIHTNNKLGVTGEIYIDMNLDIGKKVKDSFVGKVRLSQLLKKTLTVGDILPEQLKSTKQTYKNSMESKLWISSSEYLVEGKRTSSNKYEWVEDEVRTYLGDYIGSKGTIYPRSVEVAEKFYIAATQHVALLKLNDDGTARWKYKPVVAPEWAEAHPEAAEKLQFLSEGCLPREVCEPIGPLDEAPSTNGNKQPLANDAGNANNSPAVTKEDSNEAPVIEGNKQESQWPQVIVWICVFIGFVFVAGMYIRSRRIKKIK